MFHYGFELEGFTRVNYEITIPSKELPVDGFPGLVEARTSGGKPLLDALGSLSSEIIRIHGMAYVDFGTHEYKFTGAQLAELRRTRTFDKEQLDVRSIYGKEPRALNGKTLASFQINVSDLYDEPRQVKVKDKVVATIPARYDQLDIHRIVKNLDETFKLEIRDSKRQPGMYAIKENRRLEYRSLPNFVFPNTLTEISKLAERIKKAVEG